MQFYLDWQKNIYDLNNEEKFIRKFLNKDDESLKVFISGTDEELVTVCKFLLNIPIEHLVNYINEDKYCTTDKVIQYSSLYHGIVDVPRVLKFINNNLSFNELGKIIIKASEEGACKKYGENHAKLANELSMVLLERKGSINVSNTAFGNFSVNLSDEDRIELSRRLILRNDFIQKIIYLSKKGIVNYMDVACEILSESTAKRRKSNVKQLLNLALKDNKLINNIVW